MQHIINRIDAAKNCLVLTADRIDPDNIASVLLYQKLFTELGKQSTAGSFYKAKKFAEGFPGVDQIEDLEFEGFDFDHYDLIALADGADWHQFFPEEYIEQVKSKIILIDHHEGTIIKDIPDQCYSRPAACAAQIVVEELLDHYNVQLTQEDAHIALEALISDTARFSWAVAPDSFEFAARLLAAGADYARAVDFSIPQEQLDFMAWAMSRTEYHPELRMQMLVINQEMAAELQSRFGVNWNEHSKYYKFSVFRRVRDFDYGIVLRQTDTVIDLSWRTRAHGNTIEIMKVAQAAGFTAGGHRNSGGGNFDGTIDAAKQAIITELETALLNIKNED